ncbi:MAG TPA: NADPH-dependent glutamate synthase [Proteobacteria bacterium]|nr:glutamate synthase [NADPH] small chain [bacterium BMS3Abin14]HDL53082.1 NADPH-dependent glutamate synthase [Pseudomonadota bacterium]
MAEKKEKIPRQGMPEQAPDVRRKNFSEVPLGFSPETAMLEATRCIQCKKPRCVAGCPVGIDIPGFIHGIEEGDFSRAIRVLKESNALPAVCGRVCPQEDQCEILCIVGVKDEPVAIGRLERFAADWARAQEASETPGVPSRTGKKVAVVGAGPAGLTVAGDLIYKGHEVTVFEALHKPGGVLVYGIPEFRLPNGIVEAEISNLEALGVKIETNVVVGKTFTIRELMEEQGFDAAFLGVGAGLPRFMGIPGENLNGVYSANEYLTRSNLMGAYLFPKNDTPLKKARKVAVIGGGNVAMDSARTALRIGAEVNIVYRRSMKEMPARIEEIHHAQEEGIIFNLLTNPVRIIGNDDGAVTGMECLRMELGEPDESGRRRPVPIKGSEYIFDADIVIVAVGTGANPLLTKSTPGLKLNKWGYVEVDEETGATSLPGVYAGGDIVRGAATVILAMGDGRKASSAMQAYMMGEELQPETGE